MCHHGYLTRDSRAPTAHIGFGPKRKGPLKRGAFPKPAENPRRSAMGPLTQPRAFKTPRPAASRSGHLWEESTYPRPDPRVSQGLQTQTQSRTLLPCHRIWRFISYGLSPHLGKIVD